MTKSYIFIAPTDWAGFVYESCHYLLYKEVRV